MSSYCNDRDAGLVIGNLCWLVLSCIYSAGDNACIIDSTMDLSAVRVNSFTGSANPSITSCSTVLVVSAWISWRACLLVRQWLTSSPLLRTILKWWLTFCEPSWTASEWRIAPSSTRSAKVSARFSSLALLALMFSGCPRSGSGASWAWSRPSFPFTNGSSAGSPLTNGILLQLSTCRFWITSSTCCSNS